MSSAKKGGKFKSYLVFLVIGVILAFLLFIHFETARSIKKDYEEALASKAPSLTQKNIDGIYKGNLPCADCSGITETLILAKDGSYIREDLYQGKSTNPFQVQGKWQKINADILKLTASDSTDQSYLQIQANGDLQMLDDNLQKIDSPFNQTLTKEN